MIDTKKIREKLLLTQEEFSKELGVSIFAIRKWEQGIGKQRYSTQRKIIEYCKSKGIEIE